jgi:hypothetical protein
VSRLPVALNPLVSNVGALMFAHGIPVVVVDVVVVVGVVVVGVVVVVANKIETAIDEYIRL